MDTEEYSLNGRMQEFVDMLAEKEGLIKQLIDRCERQEKKVTKLLTEQGEEKAKKIPFALFKPFLFEGGKSSSESHICFRIKAEAIKNKLPIWVSSNMQLLHNESSSPVKVAPLNEIMPKLQFAEIGIQKMQSKKEEKYESQLSKDVEKLKENIGKCESLIENLKELKEMDIVEREQQQKMHTPPRSEGKRNEDTSSELKETVKQLQGDLFKLTSTNHKLRQKISQLQEAQANYLEAIKQLQQKAQDGSKLNFSKLQGSDLDKSAKRKKQKNMKRIFINY